jgi:hypothetical protein
MMNSVLFFLWKAHLQWMDEKLHYIRCSPITLYNLGSIMLLCTTQWGSINGKNELILCILNFVQMKILNDIACNLNWVQFNSHS